MSPQQVPDALFFKARSRWNKMLAGSPKKLSDLVVFFLKLSRPSGLIHFAPDLGRREEYASSDVLVPE